ncbi:MAG: hypothetical protein VKL41_04205 [Snowella sp.]|nr:hypothetical protein [Snowella sp.]
MIAVKYQGFLTVQFEVGDFCFLFKEFVPELNYLRGDNYEILLNLRALR